MSKQVTSLVKNCLLTPFPFKKSRQRFIHLSITHAQKSFHFIILSFASSVYHLSNKSTTVTVYNVVDIALLLFILSFVLRLLIGRCQETCEISLFLSLSLPFIIVIIPRVNIRSPFYICIFFLYNLYTYHQHERHTHTKNISSSSHFQNDCSPFYILFYDDTESL